MFCKNCGAKIGQSKVCPNCGFDERKSSASKRGKDADIYITDAETKRLAFSQLAFRAVVLVMSLMLLFAPVFVCIPETVDDILLEDVDDYLENDGKKYFSYFSEIKLVLEQITARESTVNISDIFTSQIWALFFVAICLVCIIVSCIIGLVKSIQAAIDIDGTKSQYYQRHQKFPKDPIIRDGLEIGTAFVVLIIAIFDGLIAFGKNGEIYRRMIARDDFTLKNFAFSFVVVLALAAAAIAIKVFVSRTDKELKKNIVKRRKEVKAENKKQNEINQKKNLERKLKEQAEKELAAKEQNAEENKAAPEAVSEAAPESVAEISEEQIDSEEDTE